MAWLAVRGATRVGARAALEGRAGALQTPVRSGAWPGGALRSSWSAAGARGSLGLMSGRIGGGCSLRAGVDDFFDPRLRAGAADKEKDKQVEPVSPGRAWRASDLRLKSHEDLHKLWFVLLKERNLLLSERLRLPTTECMRLLIPHRLKKVRKSMGAIKQVMGERSREYKEFLLLQKVNELREKGQEVPPEYLAYEKQLLPPKELTEEQKEARRLFNARSRLVRHWKRKDLKRKQREARKLGRRFDGPIRFPDYSPRLEHLRTGSATRPLEA